MPLTQQTDFTFKHSDQIDALYSVLDSTQVKAAFDSRAAEVRTALNDAIILLLSTTAGDSGAHNIGSETITGVAGNTVYAQLVALKALIDATVVGQVPLGSLTVGHLNFDPATQAELDTVNTNQTKRSVGALIYAYNNVGGAL